MKILITGSKGFIGRNLIERLSSKKNLEILEFEKDDSLELLKEYCKQCDFVYNFAAVHRPLDESEFEKVNFNQFEFILNELEKNDNKCPVLYTSSIQSNNGTLYGTSKYNAEISLRNHSKKCCSRGIVYRLTNTFGKYARPYSHSVVATFCANVAAGKELTVSDPKIIMHFAYIDDVIDSLVARLEEGAKIQDSDSLIYSISKEKIIDISLGELAQLISSFKNKTDINHLTKTERLFFETYKYYEKCKPL